MQITLTSADGSVAGVVNVPDEMELENFLAIAQSEIPSLAAVPVRQLCLHHSGRLINEYQKTLKDLGVADGDMVMVNAIPTSGAASGNSTGIDFSSIQIPGVSRRQPGSQRVSASSGQLPGEPDPASLRQALLADPAAVASLRERNPQLADALNNPHDFTRVFNEQLSTRRSTMLQRLQLLSRDPFDPEVQRLIEEEIRQQEIESHMEAAIEHMPETFAMVTMLYIRCKVNGHEVKAFVDSGAQATIMSEPCARRCNVARLIDRRFSGIARGVGVSKIVGRIHMAQLQIENDYLPIAFNVLEDAGVEMLFGLDMLKRHQCIIDLQRNVLVIGTTGSTTPFLPESELPESRQPGGPVSPRTEDRQLAEALERSAAEAEAASLAASVAATNVHRGSDAGQPGDSTSANPHQDMEPVIASNPTQSASTTTAASSVNPQNVERLVAMGFRQEDVIRELEKARDDPDKAAIALIATALPGPPPLKKK